MRGPAKEVRATPKPISLSIPHRACTSRETKRTSSAGETRKRKRFPVVRPRRARGLASRERKREGEVR